MDVESWRQCAQAIVTSLPVDAQQQNITWSSWIMLITQLESQIDDHLKSSDVRAPDERALDERALDGGDHQDIRGARDSEPTDDTSAISHLWPGALGMRSGQLLASLADTLKNAEGISLCTSGELIWLADQGHGQRGWRSLSIGVGQALESAHISSPPAQSQAISPEHLKTISRKCLRTRLAYDEARLIWRFIQRAHKRGERVFWRPRESDSYWTLA